MTNTKPEANNARLLLSEIKRDADCLLVQMRILDDALRNSVGDDQLVTVTQAVHRASELVVSIFCERADEACSAMRGAEQAQRIAGGLSIDALDIAAGVGLLGFVLTKPRAFEFRQSIDFCQTSLRLSLATFLAGHKKMARAFSSYSDTASEAAA